jgi:cytochrome P450
VVSTYAGVTLDVIGSAALGVEFKNLDAPTPFHECYERVFDPPPLGQALLAVNLFVPIRWIPLKENQRFNSDNGEIHRMTLEIVRDRIRELTDQDGKLVHTDRRDILTFMVQETIGAGKRFTDEEYRDNVGCELLLVSCSAQMDISD